MWWGPFGGGGPHGRPCGPGGIPTPPASGGGGKSMGGGGKRAPGGGGGPGGQLFGGISGGNMSKCGGSALVGSKNGGGGPRGLNTPAGGRGSRCGGIGPPWAAASGGRPCCCCFCPALRPPAEAAGPGPRRWGGAPLAASTWNCTCCWPLALAPPLSLASPRLGGSPIAFGESPAAFAPRPAAFSAARPGPRALPCPPCGAARSPPLEGGGWKPSGIVSRCSMPGGGGGSPGISVCGGGSLPPREKPTGKVGTAGAAGGGASRLAAGAAARARRTAVAPPPAAEGDEVAGAPSETSTAALPPALGLGLASPLRTGRRLAGCAASLPAPAAVRPPPRPPVSVEASFRG